ncbi:MAG: heat-inducible transcriptional repressor HrcA [Lachnospiraceae bacterium]|nr:heat-inducible transcriptional repressor HrcA [Lachnospiraceae bacterium]
MAKENEKLDELDERKIKILTAVIRNYLETGEPVGSRTISKYTDLSLSSATIRNEMADLEEMGYIFQPHTSSGRIPTDKGYRFYVDNLMGEKEREIQEKEDLIIEKADKLEAVLKQAAKLLATNTNYTALVSTPEMHRNKLKFLQLSKVEKDSILAVIVVEGNIIKNRMIQVAEEMDDDTILKLNLLLNTHLNGLSLEQINLGLITLLKERAGIHSELISSVIDAVADAIRADEDLEIYTSGATNIFKYPELTDSGKATDIINTFENKEELEKIVSASLAENDAGKNEMQVYIGKELSSPAMHDCSVVTATYDLGDGMRGTIGIVGPKRMNYEKAMGTMKSLMDQLDDIYKKK